MDARALISFGRRVAESHEPGDLVDVSADALRESFHAAVALVVIWNDGSQPDTSCSGQFPDPFVGAQDSTPVRLADLQSLLTREGIAVQRSASLARAHGAGRRGRQSRAAARAAGDVRCRRHRSSDARDGRS